jgi:predicted PurR-regulated permease PerM
MEWANEVVMSSKSDQKSEPEGRQENSGWAAPGRVQMVGLITAIALGIYLCYQMALPFLPALTWAGALGILFAPLHRGLESKVQRANLAAAITVLMVAVIVVVPTAFMGQRLLHESARGAAIIKTKVDSGEWRRALEAQPRLAPAARWVERQIDLPGTVQTLTTWLTNKAGMLVQGSLVQLIGFCLIFYLFFYFLRDRASALRSLRFLSPLSPAEMDHLFGRVEDTVFATVYGTLAVAAVQGFLGGLMFWWLDLPAPLLWGVVMGLLAVVPVLGAFIVWVPAALFLLLDGSWGKAMLLTIWGAVVVGGIDNLLLPILVGNRLKQHTLLAFLSVVGGLMVFGTSGLILGPVVLTVTTALLETWRGRATATGPLGEQGTPPDC